MDALRQRDGGAVAGELGAAAARTPDVRDGLVRRRRRSEALDGEAAYQWVGAGAGLEGEDPDATGVIKWLVLEWSQARTRA